MVDAVEPAMQKVERALDEAGAAHAEVERPPNGFARQRGYRCRAAFAVVGGDQRARIVELREKRTQLDHGGVALPAHHPPRHITQCFPHRPFSLEGRRAVQQR
ncbi:MAG TPA: hypothetical protein VGJ03_02285, partial [Acidimicrobiales bacterium]